MFEKILTCVIVAFSALMLWAFLISAVPHRHRPNKNVCMANLRTMAGAKETWAAENRKGTNSVPTTDDLFGPILYIKEIPRCPFGGTYTLNAVNQKPTCSIPDHTF